MIASPIKKRETCFPSSLFSVIEVRTVEIELKKQEVSL